MSTLRVAVPDLVSPSYFPAIAAVELGFFQRHGLEATLELVFPVTRAYEELREGRLAFVGGAAHAPLYALPSFAARVGKALSSMLRSLSSGAPDHRSSPRPDTSRRVPGAVPRGQRA
jgi:hypothetical protein